jgi:Tfp pilus assembly protein PilO
MEGHGLMGSEAWVVLAGIVVQTVLVLIGGYAVVVRNDTTIDFLKNEVTELKKNMEQLAITMTRLAVTNERVDGITSRQNMLDRRLDELSRGIGWKSARTTVDGEKPY